MNYNSGEDSQNIPNHNYSIANQFENNQTSSQVVLTAAERRVLKECRDESFYYRCLPLSTVLGGLAYVTTKFGSPKPGFLGGSMSRILGATVIGFIVGKLSYVKTCEQKLLMLPESRLADFLRKNKGMAPVADSDEGAFGTDRSAAFPAVSQPVLFDDRTPDLSSHYEGNDGYDKVTEDLSPYSLPEGSSADHPKVTYDELRMKNRGMQTNRTNEIYTPYTQEPSRSQSPSSYPSEPYTDSQYSNFPSSSRSDSATYNSPAGKSPYARPNKNKYGDVWEE